MSNLAIINEAIRSKKIITFFYKGGFRRVEPFLTGKHRDTGNNTLRAWFISGFSKSGEYNTWKEYTVDKMSNIQILSDTFDGSRTGYDPKDFHMLLVYACI